MNITTLSHVAVLNMFLIEKSEESRSLLLSKKVPGLGMSKFPIL